MALDSSLPCTRRFWPVQNCFWCFWMVLSGFILLLMVVFGVGWIQPILDGSCRFWYDLSFLFSSFHLDLDAAWWLWPVLDGSGQFKIVVPAFQWLRHVQCGYWWFCSVLDCSGLFKLVVLCSGKAYLFSSLVLAWFRCCLRVIASYRCLQPVQNSCASSSMVLSNLVWLFRVLYSIWFSWLVLDGSCTLWPDMWIFIPILSWFICCLMVMAKSRCFSPVENSSAAFWWFLQI